jgi:uncharacterized membrane protein YjdF
MKFKIGVLLTYLLQLMIAFIIISSIITGYYTFAIWGAIAIFLTFLPMIVERRINMTIPWGLTLLIVLSLYLHLAGEYFGWYMIFSPYYDKVAHLVSGSTVALLGFTVVLLMDRYTEMNFSRPMIVFMIIMITMAFGAFWEIIEFLVDTFLGGNMQHGNTDSMLDMIFVFFGAVIVAGIGNLYMRKFPITKVAEIFAGNLRLKRRIDVNIPKSESKKEQETVNPDENTQ